MPRHCLAFGMLYLFCVVPVLSQLDKVSAQVVSDASARMLRKENAANLPSSYVEANVSYHERFHKPIQEALFKNNDFERCTTKQFANGHIRETFELDAPYTCPGTKTNECLDWQCAGPTGSVRMVPSEHIESARIEAKSGGVQMCLEQKGGKISQLVKNHKPNKDYKVSIWLVGFKGTATNPDGSVSPVHCIDKDPDAAEALKHCCLAVDIDGVEKYKTEDVFDTYSGEMVYFKATKADHTISFRHCGHQADSVICIDDVSIQECGKDDAGDPDCQA